MRRPAGNLWIDTFFARKTMEMVPNQDLTGKIVVFTGGTDGLGRVAIERFAEMGADVYLIARHSQKTVKVAMELQSKGYRGSFNVITSDLSVLETVRDAAKEILRKCERIDFLINCAGGNIPERRVSAEGYELNFTLNYLSPFLLTELLLERVKETIGARIINVTSGTQQNGHLDLNDLHREKKWSLFATYAQAKLCMIMHSENVARRLEASQVTINCLNPGYIKTNLCRDVTGVEKLFTTLFDRCAAPAWVGGERVIAAALNDEYAKVSGKFIYEDMLLDPNPETKEKDKVQEMLKRSCEMTGLSYPPQ